MLKSLEIEFEEANYKYKSAEEIKTAIENQSQAIEEIDCLCGIKGTLEQESGPSIALGFPEWKLQIGV